MKDDFKDVMDSWARERRGWTADDEFSRGVMAQVRGSLPRDTKEVEKEMVPMWVPRPALASFCLVAGLTKMLLVLQVAF